MKTTNSCVHLTEAERKDLLKVTGKERIDEALQDAVEYRIMHSIKRSEAK